MRVTGGWCVFFNRGCVLHAAGAGEGDKHRYKPAVCALFPATKDQHDRWQVRQQGYNGKIWDLFCLDPKASSVPAAVSLQDEIALAPKIFPSGTAPRRKETRWHRTRRLPQARTMDITDRGWKCHLSPPPPRARGRRNKRRARRDPDWSASSVRRDRRQLVPFSPGNRSKLQFILLQRVLSLAWIARRP
jgi:hypothetical protein